MNGYLKSKGISVGERKTMQQMQTISPTAVELRRSGVRVKNPQPYTANHYGHKLHFDQNEKLLQFGVFHAACIDGFSSKIIRHIILHQKNPILLYDKLFVDIVQSEGIWDSVRVDYGTEWTVILFAQNLLSDHRQNTSKPPYSQTYSKKNLRIERWWVEVNKRVNYPIKQILMEMNEDGSFPTDGQSRRDAEEFVRRICSVGVHRLVSSWNAHRIDGRGIPNEAIPKTGAVPRHEIMSAAQITQLYRHNGGRLTMPSQESTISDPVLQAARDEAFLANCSSFEELYTSVISGDVQCFRNSLLHYVRCTSQYRPV